MKLIQREQYMDFLRGHREKHSIKVVSGVRRSGKSTLFRLYKEELLAEGVSPEQIISINFEELEYEELQEYHALHQYVMDRLIPGKMMYIFLDEIQHVPEFERAVDSLYVKENTDIYVTGSNAYFMSSEIATLLAGRYVQIEMLPLSFKEFCEAYEDRGLQVSEIYQLYLEQSSFPGALQYADNQWSQQEYLQGIINSVVLKDVMTRAKGADVQILESLLKFMVANVGSLLNPKKIADSLTSAGRKVDGRTIERYIGALRDALLMYQADRYDVRGKELLKVNAKYYMVDPAFRNILLPANRRDRGHVLENIVYLELIRRGYRVYVGHLQKGEIDFVAQKPGQVEYYQVSETVLDPNTLERELAPFSYIADNHPKILLTLDVINRNANYEGIYQYNVLDWLLGKV